MTFDPSWIAAWLSAVAALMTALAFFRSGTTDPTLSAATTALTGLNARVDMLRSLLADNSQLLQIEPAAADGLEEDLRCRVMMFWFWVSPDSYHRCTASCSRVQALDSMAVREPSAGSAFPGRRRSALPP